MTILAWVLSGVLGAFFLMAGLTKLLSSRDKLLADPKMGWANDFSTFQVKAIASLEVLGAIGLILPWLLDVAKVLTPLAAIGLAVTMVGAIVVHARRKEMSTLPINVIVIVVALAVAAIRLTQI